MTNKDKIIQFLGKAERGYDDDELSNILNIFPRQQVNQICRRLEKQGIIIRWKGSIHRGVFYLTNKGSTLRGVFRCKQK